MSKRTSSSCDMLRVLAELVLSESRSMEWGKIHATELQAQMLDYGAWLHSLPWKSIKREELQREKLRISVQYLQFGKLNQDFAVAIFTLGMFDSGHRPISSPKQNCK